MCWDCSLNFGKFAKSSTCKPRSGRTRNLYLLSIMTALMLPATLVTEFFGMNTGGLPLAEGGAGSFVAALVALGSAAIAYVLLLTFGLARR